MTCKTPGCLAGPKVDHLTLHAATEAALAATPVGWPSYDRNQAELARRSTR
jgi:hypothetical protein